MLAQPCHVALSYVVARDDDMHDFAEERLEALAQLLLKVEWLWGALKCFGCLDDDKIVQAIEMFQQAHVQQLWLIPIEQAGDDLQALECSSFLDPLSHACHCMWHWHVAPPLPTHQGQGGKITLRLDVREEGGSHSRPCVASQLRHCSLEPPELEYSIDVYNPTRWEQGTLAAGPFC